MTYSEECEGMLDDGLLEMSIYYLYTCYYESSKSLEGNFGMDRVQQD